MLKYGWIVFIWTGRTGFWKSGSGGPTNPTGESQRHNQYIWPHTAVGGYQKAHSENLGGGLLLPPTSQLSESVISKPAAVLVVISHCLTKPIRLIFLINLRLIFPVL